VAPDRPAQVSLPHSPVAKARVTALAPCLPSSVGSGVTVPETFVEMTFVFQFMLMPVSLYGPKKGPDGAGPGGASVPPSSGSGAPPEPAGELPEAPPVPLRALPPAPPFDTPPAPPFDAAPLPPACVPPAPLAPAVAPFAAPPDALASLPVESVAAPPSLEQPGAIVARPPSTSHERGIIESPSIAPFDGLRARTRRPSGSVS
jgi:hypothetical protein